MKSKLSLNKSGRNLYRQPLMLLAFVFVLSALGSTPVATASPIEPPPWSWRLGAFGFSNATEYFWTTANYNTSRQDFTRLTGDNSLSDFNSWFRARYAFWPLVSLYGGFGVGQTRAVDAVAEKTNSGFTEGYVGAQFPIWRKWILMIAELEAGMPLDAGGPTASFRSNQTVPLIADGVYYGRALLHLRKDLGRFKLFGHFGARIPTDGLAKTLPYGIFGELPLSPSILIGGGVDGEETLLSDELTAADRGLTLTSADAGSARFRPYDPAILRARGWVGFRAAPGVEFRAGYMTTILGIRTAVGQALTLNINFFTVPQKSQKPIQGPDGEVISAPGNTKDFKLESEKTDPEVIKPENEFKPQKSDDLNETERLLDGR